MRLALLFAVLIFFSQRLFAQTFNIKDYGAIADGKTVNTLALQKAVDACSANGGGMVYVPAGTFVTGTFHLKSNINLHLESGAVLKGSADLKDYDSFTQPVYGLTYYGMLYTTDAENVSITGLGTIDGNNPAFHDFTKAKKIDAESSKLTRQKANYRHVETGIGDGPVVPNKDRPHQMVIFSNCKNVHIRDVSLINSPFWTLHIADCDAVNISDIRLWSGILVPNADGIDVTSSSNVVIKGCDIRAGDDAIIVAGYDHHFEIPGFKGIKHVSENVVISDCNLQSYSSAIRIGFLDQNTVRNVHVSHVNITNSTRGIGIFLRDEGSLENITFSDIHIETHLHTGDWWGNGEPIHISAVRGKENVKMGVIKNIEFNNIDCTGENGMLIYGSAESVIQDVRFNNISFQLQNSKLNDVAGGNIDMRGALYPKDQLFASDIPGLLAHYVDGLSINNFRLGWDKTITQPYFTSGIAADYFKDLHISDFKGSAAPHNSKAAAVALSNGSKVETDVKNVSQTNVTNFRLLK
ncbi:glycoside hydrolase family 28 protein [Mucilaginibacter agri]|uniref:Rhamnogalacturonase A/B/Epimerase-like pectate lyase domain-containing protein n=1 Tax=Mucilaginibacter agri TaxID=2695265 RepID=A0A965ZIW8_9SPHI|nr:glycoside hydrolase family 28 protein [Mucilaginibacter agri]NCD70948.1 hypothetical protein [Mucilaginibacter agri]